MKGVAKTLCFLRKLLPLIEKRFYNLYKPISGLLYFLSYWKNLNSHSYTYKGS